VVERGASTVLNRREFVRTTVAGAGVLWSAPVFMSVAASASAGTPAPGTVGEPSTSTLPTPLPRVEGDCKNGGWRAFGIFRNQGDCVSYVATHGKNEPGKNIPKPKT
jgi:hypothetical protein